MEEERQKFINELNKEIIITHTITASRLLEIGKRDKAGIGAFLLYNFYCWVSSWQLTNKVKATDNFCMKGLRMGRKRFRDAKNLLLKEGIISHSIYRPKGKIEGHFIHIHFLNGFIRGTENHPMVEPSSGKQATNALDKKINAYNYYNYNNNYNNNYNKNNISAIVNYFFELKGWANKEKEFYKKNKIIYGRFTKPAKYLLELCDGSIEEAKHCLDKVAKWANSRNLGWSIETVFKKWYEIDFLKEKEKKPYMDGCRVFQRNGRWWLIEKSGEIKEYVGSLDKITYQ